MNFTIGKIECARVEIRFIINPDYVSEITLYDIDLDEEWVTEYNDPQMIMPTVTMLMYSETMREEFKNA